MGRDVRESLRNQLQKNNLAVALTGRTFQTLKISKAFGSRPNSSLQSSGSTKTPQPPSVELYGKTMRVGGEPRWSTGLASFKIVLTIPTGPVAHFTT